MLTYNQISIIYVKPNGVGNGKYYDESIPGNGPLGSIQDAINAVEQLRGGGSLQPITIKLMAGEYILSSPLLFKYPVSNVTIEPFGDGEVIISGGLQVKNFEKTTFNGIECYGAYLEDVKAGKLSFTDFYVDGLRADFTRFPETGFLKIHDFENHTSGLFNGSKWLEIENNDIDVISKFKNFEDCFISFNHYWVDEHSPIESYDLDKGRIYLKYRSRFTMETGLEYIFENVAEYFFKPNQWYLDRPSGMIYYIPRDTQQDPKTIKAYAPITSKLVSIAGLPNSPVTGIRFRNIIFANTKGDYGAFMDGEYFGSDYQSVSGAHGSIELQYAKNCSFEQITLRNYGVHGINVKDGCDNIKIEESTIYDGGAGGIRICGGIDENQPIHHTHHITVSDCTIQHMGRRYLSACGILMMHSYENDIVHNEICDLYYSGVSVGWVWGYGKSISRNNRIIANHIHHLGQGMLSDMGGIYLLGSQPGTVVRGNKIHDISCKHYGGWALYTDEGSTGMTLESNLCYRTSSNCYHQHYGSSNVVRNNIFANSREPLARVSRPEVHLCIVFTNNIFYSENGEAMLSCFAQNKPGDFSIFDGTIVSMRNIFYSKKDFLYSNDNKHATLEDAKADGLEDGSIAADPLFIDPSQDDYRLHENSPAFDLGFVPYDWSKAGPRK